MGSTKEKLLRTLDILKTTDEDHPITANRIIRELEFYSLEPERKSVLRDIKELVDYGYDIRLADDAKKGWYLASREFEDWELKVLIDAVMSAGFLCSEDTDRIIEKLCALTSDESKKSLRLMTVPPNVKTGDKRTKYVIDTVMTAVRGHKKVHFDYVFTGLDLEKTEKHPGGTLPVSPYALIWKDENYYLIANYRKGAGLSYYRIDRIRNITIMDEAAAPLSEILGSDEGRKLREFIRRNIYNKKGDTVTLRLKIRENGVDAVIDSFGDNVHVTKNADGTVSAAVTTSDSDGLYAWLMRYGSRITVVEPESVRNEMLRRLKSMAKSYGG